MEQKDFFIERDGKKFAGFHLILDVHDTDGLDDMNLMESVLDRAVAVSGATKLHGYLHHFTPNGGVSGVYVLSESHISLHTWPEKKFASFDVFMCGEADPHAAVSEIIKSLSPGSHTFTEIRRGCVDELG